VKNRLTLYFFLLLLWWMIGCEFEVPTMPRLPARWNSKVIIPLLDKTYSFLDMVYDSTATRNNSIYTDTLHRMYYFAIDTPGQKITIADDYWKIQSLTIQKQIILSTSVDATVNEPVSVYRTNILGEISTKNNRVIYGKLNSDNGTSVNSIRITATLSDTLSNDVDIEIFTRNFKSLVTDTLWFGTLSLAANVLENSITFNVADDSLFSSDRTAFIDSLDFGLTVQIQDTLQEELTQNLVIRIDIAELHMDSFYGKVNASGYLTAQQLLSSPAGADSILFNEALADFYMTDPGSFESINFLVTGKKQHGTDTTLDSIFTISGTAYRLDIASVMSNLPDSITFYIEASLPTDQYDGSAMSEELTIGYQLFAPLRITLPAEMYLTAADPTRFFIKDSLTRSNVIRSQNGAQFDISVTNRTPFSGSIYLLIGNHREFPTDSVEADWYTGYEYINDTLYYIAADTEMVLIDTLAVIDLPLAQMRNDTLLYAGVGDLFYMADSSALALLADTCYILPKFYLTNPDTTQVLLRSDYSIGLKTYLNLLFDPSVLNQTEIDTTDTTG